jgi:hypothetical protein
MTGRRNKVSVAATAFIVVTVPVLLAQSALLQLGLTESAARTFLLNEIKSPAVQRNSAIVQAGNRAFLKLPPAARGAAATGLFAWAKAYVNSAAFKAEYTRIRRDRIPVPVSEPPVDEAVRKRISDELASLEQSRQAVSFVPAAERPQVLEALKQQEAILRSPETFNSLKSRMEADRAERDAGDAALIRSVDESFPADPQRLFARRLREFLVGTSDVNFSAKTINLTGDADGFEFVEPADRKHSWLWEEAAIVGKEATSAARAAAEEWLKEIGQ